MNLRVKLFLLMLLGSTCSLFSASSDLPVNQVQEKEQEAESHDLLGEQITSLFDSILPTHKNLLFSSGGYSTGSDFEAHILNHTFTSLNYIKRSRYIIPGLGVKEVIFPFHIFL